MITTLILALLLASVMMMTRSATSITDNHTQVNWQAPRPHTTLEDILIWAFGVATVITNVGKGIIAKRMLGGTPAQIEPNFIGMGVGATGAARTAVVGDTALSTAVESRVSGTSSTVTTTQTNDTYQSVATITATAGRAVDEAGMFDASSAGNMFFSATMNVITLVSGDSIQFTMKTQMT